MLLALGPYAYSDPVLLYKVIRIIKSSLGIGAKDERVAASSADPDKGPYLCDVRSLFDC